MITEKEIVKRIDDLDKFKYRYRKLCESKMVGYESTNPMYDPMIAEEVIQKMTDEWLRAWQLEQGLFRQNRLMEKELHYETQE